MWQTGCENLLQRLSGRGVSESGFLKGSGGAVREESDRVGFCSQRELSVRELPGGNCPHGGVVRGARTSAVIDTFNQVFIFFIFIIF